MATAATKRKTNQQVVNDNLSSINSDSDIILSGVKARADLTEAISDINVMRTIDGAPTLTMTVSDPQRTLLKSNILSSRATMKVDAFTFEVAQVSKSGTQLSVTCEDQVVAELREHNSILKIATGKMTHVQFARLLAREVGFIKFVTDPNAKVVRSLEPLTRGTVSKKGVASKVDSWTCLNNLASARGWRVFVRGVDTLYYVPDSYLFDPPADYRLSESSDGVDSIDFDFDKGKKVATCTITCESGRWEVPPGETVELFDMGTANGKWLVQDISKSIYALNSTITLIHPRPVLPEPKPTATATGGDTISSTLGEGTLSHSSGVRVAQYAIAAGFRGGALLTAVMVSFAEDSSHGPSVFSDPNTDGSIDRGLWQINDHAHPNYSDADMRDPLKNAKAAYAISSSGTNWSPWTTYASGAYLKYRTVAEKDIAAAIKLMTITAGNGSTGVNAFVQLALDQRGKAYVYGAAVYPGSSNPTSFDCSSLVAWAADRVGINLTAKGIRTAEQEYQYCVSHGTAISVRQAINTRGALVFENTPATHVVISLGNGDTIEAMDTAYGVREGGFSGRNWTHGGLLPGLAY